MLNLQKDLLARLAISAQRDRSLNAKFRVNHIDAWKLSMPQNVLDGNVSRPIISLKSPTVEKIDETVDKIINNPALMDIKVELEFAEELLKKIKEVDKHNPKISVIEGTIVRLKTVLDQKMYV